MKLIKAADLAAEWDMSEPDLLRRRRRYGWPCVQLSRQDVRFTEQQVEQIVAMQSRSGKPTPKKDSKSTGQTKRSASRAS